MRRVSAASDTFEKDRMVIDLDSSVIPRDLYTWMSETSRRCIITGSFATHLTMLQLDMEPGFEPSDIDIFYDAEETSFEELPGELVSVAPASSYEIEIGSDDYTWFLKSIIYRIVNGKRVNFLALVAMRDDCREELRNVVPFSMDFTIVSNAIHFNGENLELSIYFLDDVRDRKLRLISKSLGFNGFANEAATKMERVTKWKSRGFNGEIVESFSNNTNVSNSEIICCSNLVVLISDDNVPTKITLSENVTVRGNLTKYVLIKVINSSVTFDVTGPLHVKNYNDIACIPTWFPGRKPTPNDIVGLHTLDLNRIEGYVTEKLPRNIVGPYVAYIHSPYSEYLEERGMCDVIDIQLNETIYAYLEKFYGTDEWFWKSKGYLGKQPFEELRLLFWGAEFLRWHKFSEFACRHIIRSHKHAKIERYPRSRDRDNIERIYSSKNIESKDHVLCARLKDLTKLYTATYINGVFVHLEGNVVNEFIFCKFMLYFASNFMFSKKHIIAAECIINAYFSGTVVKYNFEKE